MRQKTVNIYKFDELNEEAKENAVNRLRDINFDHEWWDFIYEDAERASIKITAFDTDHYCKGKLIDSAETSIVAILKDHGKDCETYKTAQSFKEQFDSLSEDEENYEDIREDLTEEYLQSILEDYRIMLRKEYEYLMSNESIIETIEANEYEFTEEGKLTL